MVGGLKALNYVPFNYTFRILIIALISGPMILSMKIKIIMDEGTRHFSKCIPCM